MTCNLLVAVLEIIIYSCSRNKYGRPIANLTVTRAGRVGKTRLRRERSYPYVEVVSCIQMLFGWLTALAGESENENGQNPDN